MGRITVYDVMPESINRGLMENYIDVNDRIFIFNLQWGLGFSL